MKKPEKKDLPHLILCSAAWLLFAGCLIRFLAVYGSLADEIGVHFDGNGDFDVIDKKVFGFYPFLISLITLVICSVLAILVRKVSVGKNMTERGERLSRSAVMLYFDFFQLVMAVFFSGVWSDCVIHQQPLNTYIPVILLFITFGLLIALFVFLVVVSILCREKK